MTLDDIKTAEELMAAAALDAALNVTYDRLYKTANVQANMGMTPLLAFTVALVKRLRDTPAVTPILGTDGALYYRRPELDRRIGRGDDFAGDAWVRYTAPGAKP